MTSILAPQTSALESSIAEMEAAIAASRQRLSKLQAVEASAQGVLLTLQEVVGQFSVVVPDALGTLQSKVLSLFQGDDNNGNDDGNTPAPQPQPNGDGGIEATTDTSEQPSATGSTALEKVKAKLNRAYPWPAPQLQAEQVSSDVNTTESTSAEIPASDITDIATNNSVNTLTTEAQPCRDVTTGLDATGTSTEATEAANTLNQSVKVVNPQPEVELQPEAQVSLKEALQQANIELAARLTELGLDGIDAPQEPEYVEAIAEAPELSIPNALNSTTEETNSKEEAFNLIPVSDSVAYFRNNKTGEIACCYLGGNNKQKLKLWGEWLCHQHSVGSGFQLRDAERLTAFKHEIKIWGMSLAQIQRLAESNTQKNPPSNFGTFPVRKIDPVAPLPKPLQIDDVEVGDTVRSTTVKNWSYVVLAKMENGMLDCQRSNTPEGTPEIRLAVHPANVELVSKAIKAENSEVSQHISIDINDVPVGVKLERTSDALITEYRVWAWCAVRVFGKPELQEKSIGILVESSQGINAHRIHGMSTTQPYNRAFDAVKHLVQAAGLKLADIEAAYNRHQEEVGLASIQPPVLQPQPVATQQPIEASDWVELLVTGDRYQVNSVDAEGVHLTTDDGNMLVQLNEVHLLMKIPPDWKPFGF